MNRGEGPNDIGNRVGTVQVAVEADQVRITLAGDIDIELDDELDIAALEVHRHALPVVIDATGVTFMDSAGARLIARCHMHGPVKVAASPAVRFLLQVLAMDDLLM